MKKILLICLVLGFASALQAQTETYFIDWSFDSNSNSTGSTNADRTVEVGDTVTWVWYADGTHNVVSNSDATESFQSELLGPGSTFSHTFTEVGSNGYVCTPHSGNMFGVITVVPDGSLNTEDFAAINNINLYPNPAKDKIFINIGGNISTVLDISVYNTLGQKVRQFQKEVSGNTSFDLSELNSGIYFLKFVDGENAAIKRLIIQ